MLRYVRPFSNISQMTSKCAKDKIFDVFCDLLLNTPTETLNLIVLYDEKAKCN